MVRRTSTETCGVDGVLQDIVAEPEDRSPSNLGEGECLLAHLNNGWRRLSLDPFRFSGSWVRLHPPPFLHTTELPALFF